MRLSLLILIAGSLLIAGCGGGETSSSSTSTPTATATASATAEATTEKEWASKVTAVCRQNQKQARKLVADVQGEGLTGRELAAEVLDRSVPLERRLVDKLGAVPAPDATQDDFDQFVGRLRDARPCSSSSATAIRKNEGSRARGEAQGPCGGHAPVRDRARPPRLPARPELSRRRLAVWRPARGEPEAIANRGGVHAAHAPSRALRPRTRRVLDRGRARIGRERRAGVDDDGGPAEPADAAVRRVDRRAGRGRPDDHRRPVAAVPADRRLRRLDHRLVGLPAGQRRRIATRSCATCSTREDGIGLSYLRQPMGASDFVKGPHYTYDDMPAGKTDFDMARFSVAHDEKEILPLLRQALRHNRNLKVMGTPWSPPAWMKTPESLVGGRFIDDERYYDAYTRYFVKFVQAYARAGVPVDARDAPERAAEPHSRSSIRGWTSATREEARLIKSVGPAFQKAGIDTKILGYDHNWSLHPNDVGLPGANPEYAKALLDDPEAKRWLAGTAFHCYSGDPSAQSELTAAHPDRDIYFTECSGIESGDPATTFPDTLHWHSRFLTIGATRNWAQAT